MTGTLLRKLLRDVRVPLVVVCLLLTAFEALWAKVTERVSSQLLPQLLLLTGGKGVSASDIEKTIFEGPGKLIKTMFGGENISLFRTSDMATIGYVHPTLMIILGLWAVGRAAGAIVGEVDRGTMELLLAQPVARSRIVLAHFVLDLILIPLLCLSVWAGNYLGIALVGLKDDAGQPIDAALFGRALWNVAGLVFAISGYTIWLSARGRFRNRVLGLAVLVTLLQYLVNVLGQLWDAIGPLRQFTVFYYYQPQQIILPPHAWSVPFGNFWGLGTPTVQLNVLAVLFAVGFVGYGMAFRTFCRRDVPAPL